MVREAESHANEDRRRRELVEARNEADALMLCVIEAASLLNVQQKFRVVRQLALKLHQLEAGVKLQDDVLSAASDIKVP